MQTTTHSLEEFSSEARRIASGLKASPDHATIVALSGDLGAGKTTFVQQVAAYFGIPESVTSPTFVIEKVYQLPNVGHPMSYTGLKLLIHIDAYRLKSSHDLKILGWPELIAEPSNLILIEWPERVAEAIPPQAIRISIEHIDAETRGITIVQ
ncbi:tRNA (adenosine(37)-N6)-threonylcarbamoyltransferase complex ATPase subunit type 1 TsaE [Candidatus Kaiserbacteria bacterium]|nr:tRNA (adenosine(37)-N6)-threonylcarbamoyltransferase complex ATPase subunit type 1 TsaE [Candidatus Kaiserbacteria bacterium]